MTQDESMIRWWKYRFCPENQPINPSPWYAFKIWAEEEKPMWIRLTYPANGFHRYYPKINKRGLFYKKLDSVAFHPHEKSDGRRAKAN